jgi:RNA polymerase sigma-70 factor (ECF subfamily)
MTGPDESQTRVTLLGRLARPGEPDQDAWAEFVRHYGSKVYQWCLRWQLQQADAEDVTQIVLLKLAARMKDFQYDPSRSFRGWLKTVAHHAWQDFLDARRRTAAGQGGDEALELLQSIEAREDLAWRLEQQYDHELMGLAAQVVRPQVAPHNWEAFRLTALEGVPAAEAARRLDMKIARVYAARSHIQQRLKEECQRLEEQPPRGARPGITGEQGHA